MDPKTIMERLAAGEILLMDGGTGSELQRRGVNTQKAIADNQGNIQGIYPWRATANLDAPEVVKQVHADYLRVGANLIISNSFWTNRIRLEPVGLGDRWKSMRRPPSNWRSKPGMLEISRPTLPAGWHHPQCRGRQSEMPRT